MFPCASRYIVGVARCGAFSRKSKAVVRPDAARMTMKPPPPIFPADGCVTASANPVATAASTALPPRASTDAPASQAGADTQTTRPSFAGTPGASCAARPGRVRVMAQKLETSSRTWIFRIDGSLQRRLGSGTGIVECHPKR
jgi:hypothetical protein